MAYRYGPFSLLLTRRFHLSCSLNPRPSFSLFHLLSKPLSTTPDSDSNPKPSSLSARLSFVFDQIDAIEKERSQKHETLQRIRAWRQSNNTHQNDTQPEPEPALPADESPPEPPPKKEVEFVHPWPEWIQLMETLVYQNYFDHRRKDEDKMVHDLGFDPLQVAEGFDFTKDFKSVHMACLNFGKDRFDVLRSLSRKDIQVLVGFGCPTVDKKVVFSAKLLRKHVHLDEGDVCSSCSLRNNCERAYLLTNKEDEARTLDVMRLLLTFGFDPVDGSVINKSLLKHKSVKTVVRKLINEVVKLSSVPIDPNLPPPVIKKPPPKVKQPPPPPKRRVGRDDVEMKKGDWLCPKCEFMNFAKNTVCLQCDAKRPKRQLLPGEWECPECNFLNYRRNMVCFHCECKRPPDEFLENKMLDRKQNSKPKLDRMGSQQEVSNAWNFDFDDNESDGADVAAFEYADTRAIDEDSPSDNHAQHGNHRGWEDDSEKNNRVQGSPDGEYANPGLYRPRIGFDDFEDEDDIDSYELESQTQNSSTRMEASKNNFLEAEYSSELEDIEDADYKMHARHRTAPGRSVQSLSMHRNTSFSASKDDELDFGTDEQRSILSNFKSGHVSAADRKRKGRGPSKKLSYGSESEEDIGAGLYSDEDDDLNEEYSFRKNKGNRGDPSRQRKGNRCDSGRRNFTKDRKSGSIGGRQANMFCDDFDGSFQQSYRNGRGSRGNDRNRKSFEDFDGPSRRSYGDGRGSRGNNHIGSSRQSYRNGRGSRGNDRNWHRFEDKERGAGQFNKSSMGEKDFGEFRNSRRVIER
ncbi:Zinc finger protein VAR3, chloroplastic, partial [Mucuna pruriens]